MNDTKWKSTYWTGWKKSPNAPGEFRGQFVGTRDDGKVFCINAVQLSLDKLKRTARLELDRFLEVE